jgi:hypothetical protein
MSVEPQPYQPIRPGPAYQPVLRCAHADRERTVDVLRAAYAEGRLNGTELEQRTQEVHAAATYQRLGELVADLPVGPLPFPPAAEHPAALVPAMFRPPAPSPGRVNPTAVAALVLGLLEVPTAGLTGIGALVCGHVARGQMRERGEQGAGMAGAGVVLGWLAVAGWSLLLLLLVVVLVIGFLVTGSNAMPTGP